MLGNERQTRHKHEVDDEILQGSQTGDNSGASQYLLVSENLREQDWEVDEMDSQRATKAVHVTWE